MNMKQIKRITRAALSLLCAAACLLGACDYFIPSRMALRELTDFTVLPAAVELCFEEAMPASGATGVYEGSARLLGVIPLKKVDVRLIEDIKLLPGGMPFGVQLCCEGVLIVGIGEVECASPARDAGLQVRDVICAIDGRKITSAAEVAAAVASGGGREMCFEIRRAEETLRISLTPVYSEAEGRYRTGLWIKDSTAGIGTVTFIDPETGGFAGLGHGICDADTGELLPLERGSVVNVEIGGVMRGEAGAPGELKGYFSSGKIGTLLKNTECGVFGVFARLPDGAGEESLPIALASEVKEGEAEILCTTDSGGIGRYSIRISRIDRTGRDVKNFVVTVTDEALIAKTGGIVQGMSGSTIIQNGKIVGAVTHVLINDPTKGYGIFIENMLSAAGWGLSRAS